VSGRAMTPEWCRSGAQNAPAVYVAWLLDNYVAWLRISRRMERKTNRSRHRVAADRVWLGSVMAYARISQRNCPDRRAPDREDAGRCQRRTAARRSLRSRSEKRSSSPRTTARARRWCDLPLSDDGGNASCLHSPSVENRAVDGPEMLLGMSGRYLPGRQRPEYVPLPEPSGLACPMKRT
jgi:hypothetical protein